MTGTLLRLRLRVVSSVCSPLVGERYRGLVTERSTRSSGVCRLRSLRIWRLTSSSLPGLLILPSVVRELGTLLRLELGLRLLRCGVLVRRGDAVCSASLLTGWSSSTGIASLSVLVCALGIVAVVTDHMLPPEALDPFRRVVVDLLLLSLLLVDPLHLFFSKGLPFLTPLLRRRIDRSKPILCKINGHQSPSISRSKVIDVLLLLSCGFIVEFGEPLDLQLPEMIHYILR